MKKIFLFLSFLFIVFLSFSQNAPITSFPVIEFNKNVGDTVEIPIYVKNFNSIGAISLTINFDKNSLTFIKGNITSSFDELLFNSPNDSTVKMGGYKSNAVSLTDNSILCKLVFKYKGNQSYFVFNDNGPSCEYTNGNYLALKDTPTKDFFKDGFLIVPVVIGNQTWMKYNLNVGKTIPTTQYQSNNNIIEKWCYNNLESNCNLYGGYYEWKEMLDYNLKPSAQGICPTGWHIPTIKEFNTLASSTGDIQKKGIYMQAARSLKNNLSIGRFVGRPVNSVAWTIIAPTDGEGQPTLATNTSGFSGLPSGWVRRNYPSGDMGVTAWFWSSEKTVASDNVLYPIAYQLYTNHNAFPGIWQGENEGGLSVRCIKNGSDSVPPPPPPINLGSCPVIKAPYNLTVVNSEFFDIPINVSNYWNVTNGNLYIGFDQKYLKVVSVVPNQNITLTYSSIATDIVYVKITSNPLTLTDNSILFTLKCQSLKTGTFISPIIWETNSNWNFTPVLSRDYYYYDGNVKITYVVPVIPPKPVVVENVTITAEKKITNLQYPKFGYAISAQKFTNVSNLSFTVNYDPKIIKVITISKSSGLIGQLSSTNSVGSLIVKWSATGKITKSDGTIMTITIQLASTTWKGTTPITFISTDGKTYVNGSITVK